MAAMLLRGNEDKLIWISLLPKVSLSQRSVVLEAHQAPGTRSA
jgi:hypothetical protein